MFLCCCTTDRGDGVGTGQGVAATSAASVSFVATETLAAQSGGRARRGGGPPAFEFVVALQRARAAPVEREPLGARLEVFGCSTSVFVTSVSSNAATLIGRYNQEAPKELQICKGDYLLAVNGMTDSEEVKQALAADERLRIAVCRPQPFLVDLATDGEPLGLGLKYDREGASLAITAIEEGGVARALGADLEVGDRIVAVNGRGGPAEMLLRELSGCRTASVLVSRPGSMQPGWSSLGVTSEVSLVS